MTPLTLPTSAITIDIKASSTEQLLAFYNEHSGTKPVAKFSDRASAEKRVAELIEAHNELASGASKGAKAAKAVKKGSKKAPAVAAAPVAPAKKGGKKAPAVAEAPAVKVSSGKGTNVRFARAGGKFYKLVKENPRREGTWGFKSFNLLQDGMTYKEYIAAGGRNNDLRWDVDRGWVEQR